MRVLPNGLTVEIGADGKIVEENYAKLRVKDIRERLDSAGINYAGVKEKDALVKLLKTALTEATAAVPDDDSVATGGVILVCVHVCVCDENADVRQKRRLCQMMISWLQVGSSSCVCVCV